MVVYRELSDDLKAGRRNALRLLRPTGLFAIRQHRLTPLYSIDQDRNEDRTDDETDRYQSSHVQHQIEAAARVQRRYEPNCGAGCCEGNEKPERKNAAAPCIGR